MKHNKILTALALTMSLTLSSCSDDSKTQESAQTLQKASAPLVSQKTQQSEILSYIPSDTPILVVFNKDPKHPLPQNFINKMDQVYNALGEMIQTVYLDAMKKTASPETTKTIDEFAQKWLNKDGFNKLGINMNDFELALYTIDLFPVLRLNLAKNNAMNELIDELMVKANTSKPDTASKKDVQGRTIYQFGDKEAKILVSLKGQEMVVSFSPTREVEKLMPKLLGFKKPSKNITQSSQYNDTMSKYKYISTGLYWIDMRALADYFINPSKHPTPMLDLLQVQDGKLSADCKTEILQMFDKVPRIVGGTTLLDEHAMDSHAIIEMKSDLGTQFSKMIGRIPNAITAHELAYGFSFDLAGAKQIAMEFVNRIEAQPYKCEFFTDINTKVSTLKAQLNQPLPPFVGNFKGINFVINDIEIDMSQKEPKDMIKSLKAQVLIAVDSPETILGMGQSMLPELQKLGLKVDGQAVNVSSLIPVSGKQMPVNLDNVYMAIGKQTIGISIGLDTDKDLTKTVAADARPTLFNFDVSAELYKNLYSSITLFSSTYMSDEQKQKMKQQAELTEKMLWWKKQMADVTFTDRGFEIKADINY